MTGPPGADNSRLVTHLYACRMAGVRTHPYGEQDTDLAPSALDELVTELSLGDREHSGVSVMHESGWSLAAYRSGTIVWENVEDDAVAPRHRTAVTPSEVRRLFGLLADGDIVAVDEGTWAHGYGR